LAKTLKRQVVNEAHSAPSRREHFQNHIDMVSSSMVDMIHSFERQCELMQETLRRLEPIHDNHVRILTILNNIRERLDKEI